MRLHSFILSLIMLIMFCITGLVATPARAADADIMYNSNQPLDEAKPMLSGGDLQTVDASGKKISCSDIKEVKGGKIVGKIVPCMVRTIQNATQRFSAKMVGWLRPLLYTFLTLVIVLFGVRMLTGEQEIHKHGLLLLIKVGLVITVLDLTPGTLVPATYDIMKESQDIILNALNTGSMKCGAMPNKLDWGGPDTLPVWAITDCILGKLFGFTVTGVGDGKPGMIMGASALGLMSGILFGGAWGVVVFFGILGILISIFTLVVRTVYSFLAGYLIICLMLIISPLLLPLMFLRITQGYAEPIWRNILSAFLMPIIVTSYTMIGLMMYDRMLFADDSMLNTLFDATKIDAAKLPPTQPCSVALVNNVGEQLKKTGSLSSLTNVMKDMFLQSPTNPQAAGAGDSCSMLKLEKFDISQVNDPKFQKGSETYSLFFEQLMTLLILGYLIHLGLGMLNNIVAQLSLSGGSIGAAGAMTAAPAQRLDAALTSGRNAAISSFEESRVETTVVPRDGGASGFIRKGVEGFFGNITKDKK